MKPQLLQTIENLKGEVEFRKKLAQQHVTGEILLPDYYDKAEHDQILLQRVDSTKRKMRELHEHGVALSPFIELGAERCQRSLVLTNDFGASGFAVDISYHQLKTASHFAELFQRPTLPHRVCCDVNNLPFRNGSFPFVFCYEFLHHFPSPQPILREIYRILSDGFFFFDEEPFRKPRLVLYKQKDKFYSRANLRKNQVLRHLEQFVSEKNFDEQEHGLVENHDISLRAWLSSLSIFTEKEIHISSFGNRIRTRLGNRISPKNIPNMLLGGGVTGLCRKKGVDLAIRSELADLLLCPNCMSNSPNQDHDQPALIREPNAFRCSSCGSTFPIIDGIMFLLPSRLFQALYPEFVDR